MQTTCNLQARFNHGKPLILLEKTTLAGAGTSVNSILWIHRLLLSGSAYVPVAVHTKGGSAGAALGVTLMGALAASPQAPRPWARTGRSRQNG